MNLVTTRVLLTVVLVWAGAMATFPAVVRAQASGIAPTLIPVSGEFRTADGQPRTGTVLLVISLYEGQNDSAPRWIEHQTVTLDAAGRYSVQFGATFESGLPSDLFTTTGVRWIGVKIDGDATEQPRVALVSVPYAAKAASADMLGGRTATDFVLSSNLQDDVRAVLESEGMATAAAAPGSGVVNYVQKADGTGGLADSVVYESGGNVGIGTDAPQARLHLRAPLNLAGFRLESTEPGGAAWQVTSALDGQLRFTEIGVASRMVIQKTNGFIGIGTTAPQALVHMRAGQNAAAFRLENAEPTGATWQVTSAGDGQLRFTELGVAARMIVQKGTGNVGIGTSAPTAKLHVAGDVIVDGNIGAKYQDVAEWVDAVEPLEAGTLVTIDTTGRNRVTAAASAYDARVAGAVSPQPGLILGEAGEGRVLVAQSGRVRVKADATFGAIRPGDILVSSPTKGHVMRSTPIKVGKQLVHRSGTVVGKALEALPNGRGEILVLLTLQ